MANGPQLALRPLDEAKLHRSPAPPVRRPIHHTVATVEEAVARAGHTPCQPFRCARSKNSSDAALIMDAMERIQRRCVEGLCIVSSDSDFTGRAGAGGGAGGVWL
ncbi:NYN domain-containing protein [Hydrogenophaga sp.]|uniref:NYN domain-containing protein n=1 Tax=Hydrogenophaga sp. TaxID=1904254 RepID=UPI00344CD60A|nr:NYN domain-containing protein [Hydrogenophaga sp.]